MIIDFHTHTFPDRIAKAAIDKLALSSGTVPFLDGTNGSLTRSGKETGIDLSVVLPVATNPDKVAHINEISASLDGREGLCHFGCLHPTFPISRGKSDISPPSVSKESRYTRSIRASISTTTDTSASFPRAERRGSPS